MKVLKIILLVFLAFSCTDAIDIEKENKYEEAMSLYKNEDYDAALSKLDFVFENIEGEQSEFVVKALYLRGFIYYLKDDNKAAYKDYLQAIEIASELGDQLRVSKLYNEIGQIFYESELYDQAYAHFQLALNLADHATTQDRANYNYGVGKSLKEMGKAEEGVGFLLESIDINLELNNFSALANSYNEVAIAQLKAGNKAQALDLYAKIEKIASLSNNADYHFWSVYNNMGNVYLEIGDMEKAEHYLRTALDYRSNKTQLWITYNNLGKVYNANGEYEKAWNCFKRSLVYNSKKGEVNELAITNNALKKTFEKLNQPDSLLHYTMLINDMALPMMETKSWLQDEDEKIALLTKYQEYEKQQSEKEQYAKTSWLMAFIMTFIFVSGVLTIRLWRIYHYKSPQKSHALIKNSGEMVYLLDMFKKEKDEMKKMMDQKIGS